MKDKIFRLNALSKNEYRILNSYKRRDDYRYIDVLWLVYVLRKLSIVHLKE